ncbi:MAG TPA: hypothetical protein VK629_02545, partial [Steroidobacteraceae bacterium]|nr:hypothetical protein [Steroidobacteraceae bacterium]
MSGRETLKKTGSHGTGRAEDSPGDQGHHGWLLAESASSTIAPGERPSNPTGDMSNDQDNAAYQQATRSGRRM